MGEGWEKMKLGQFRQMTHWYNEQILFHLLLVIPPSSTDSFHSSYCFLSFHLFLHSPIHPFNHLSIYLSVHSSIPSFLNSSIPQFIYFSIHLFIHSSISPFICLFIHKGIVRLRFVSDMYGRKCSAISSKCHFAVFSCDHCGYSARVCVPWKVNICTIVAKVSFPQSVVSAYCSISELSFGYSSSLT